MAWETYAGLRMPNCAQCCQCQIVCESHEFDGSPAIDTVALVANSGTDPTFCSVRSINVTVAVEGNTLTSTGTITNSGGAATAVAGVRSTSSEEASGRQACGFFTGATSTGIIDMNGTATYKWGVNLVYIALRAWLFGDAAFNIDAQASIGSCQKLVSVPVIGASIDPPVTGHECISYFDRDVTNLVSCNGIGTTNFLTDGTLQARYVRARLRLTGLTIGETYLASLIIMERARGSSDPWTFNSSNDYEFTADETIEYTTPVNVGGSDSSREFAAMSCTLRIKPAECGFEPTDPYMLGFDQGMACDVCNDGSGGCPNGPSGSFSNCWFDGWTEGSGIAASDAYNDGYNQGLTCVPCDDGSGSCPGGTPCADAWLNGYTQGYTDGGCP